MSLRIAFFYLSAVVAASASSLVADSGGRPTIATILVLAACGAPIALVAVAVLEGVGQRQVPILAPGGHRGRLSAWSLALLSTVLVLSAGLIIASEFTAAAAALLAFGGILCATCVARIQDRRGMHHGDELDGARFATPPEHAAFPTHGLRGHARSQQLVALRGADAKVVCYFVDIGFGGELELPDAVQSDIPTLYLEPSDDAACQWSPSSSDSGHITVARYQTPGELGPLVERWMMLQRPGGRDGATDMGSADGIQLAPTQVVLRCSLSGSTAGTLVRTELAALQEAAARNTWGAATIVELLTNGRRSLVGAGIGRQRLNTVRDWVLLEKRLHL
jgi:hypothetical protein